MKNIALLMLLVALLSSCGSSTNRFIQDERGGDTYSSTEIGKFSRVSEGSIVAIKVIKISGSKILGTGVGATLGALAASNAVGGKADKVPAAVVGGLLGAIVGKTIEESTTAEDGFEFLVKLTNGEVKSFAQKSMQGLRVGDQVYIVHSGKTVRLTRK